MLSSFENGDSSGSTEVKELVFEEERQAITVLVVLNRTYAPFEPEHVVIPDGPIIDQPADLNIKIPSGRFNVFKSQHYHMIMLIPVREILT